MLTQPVTFTSRFGGQPTGVAVVEREVQYLVLKSQTDPFMLARVRWPDICQAVSPVRRDWQDDPGLFDLPYESSSTRITHDEAQQLAAEWGADLPAEDDAQQSGSSLIRRLPSEWSRLSTAERRAWAIDTRPARAARAAKAATGARPARTALPARLSILVSMLLGWRRQPLLVEGPLPHREAARVLELAEARESALAVDHA